MVKVVNKRCIQERLCMQLHCTVSLGLGLVDWRKIALSNTERKCPSKTRLTELPDGYYLTGGSKDRGAVQYPPATCEVERRYFVFQCPFRT